VKYTNTIRINEFCKVLGVKRHHPQQSWSSYNREREIALFTIWDNEIIDGAEYKFHTGNSNESRKRFGATEIVRILEESIKSNFRTYGILCERGITKDGKAKIVSFEDRYLLDLRVEKLGDEFIATLCGMVPADVVRENRPINEAMAGSAIDDSTQDDLENDDPKYREIMSRYVVRDYKVRKQVLKRAKGKCEYGHSQLAETKCDTFIKRNGDPYLEAHHVLKLADQGKDEISNVIALCANHHREAHSGQEWEYLNVQFQKIVDQKMKR
jgi:5-methylcytosine-specific restriction enzyme A